MTFYATPPNKQARWCLVLGGPLFGARQIVWGSSRDKAIDALLDVVSAWRDVPKGSHGMFGPWQTVGDAVTSIEYEAGRLAWRRRHPYSKRGRVGFSSPSGWCLDLIPVAEPGQPIHL